VPRVLGLSTIDGKALPAMHYTSPTFNSDAWTDSGSATLQDDSLLVVRTYTHWVEHGAGSQAPAASDSFTTAGRLQGNGVAIFPYSNGTADTAYVRANGAIEAHLSLNENGARRPFGVFLFAAAYNGGALNPVPYVRQISPDTAAQFADSAVITLLGTSFLPTTRVSWDNSIPLVVRYVNPYQLTVVIPGEDLGVAGAHTLTVANQGPGGGERRFNFAVSIPEPMLISISPTSIVASGGDFTLHVHGRGFIQGRTQVLWNGSPRTAVVSSETDLTTTISNADVATAGTNQVAVQTTPPGGGTTGVIAFTVTGSAAKKYAEAASPFAAAVLIADPSRALVYALPSSFETSHPRSVAAIDPTSGAITWTVDLDARPTAMAVADDGSTLYAYAVDTVYRISLATHAVNLRIPIPVVSTSWVDGLAVMPGHPATVAVQYECPCDGIGLSKKIELFDDAQMRPTVASTYTQPGGPIGFSSPQELHTITANSVSDYTVSTTGVTLAAKDVALVGYSAIYIDGTRAFTGSGALYDLVTHVSRQIPGMPGQYAAALSSDASLLYGVDQNTPFVRAYDTSTGAEVGAIPITTSSTTPRTGTVMIRWGQDGIAVTLMDKVVFLRADLIH
jgi:hypothetical protein